MVAKIQRPEEEVDDDVFVAEVCRILFIPLDTVVFHFLLLRYSLHVHKASDIETSSGRKSLQYDPAYA